MAEAPKQVADRLFQLPPKDFVTERDLAVAEARAAGDQDAARALAALRRPTVAAWLVNLLALRRPELVTELVELAQALSEAQRSLQGERLRELAGQRRAVIEALVGTARSLAREVEPDLTAAKLPLAEVETTLAAALSDPEVAAQVRAGRLQRPVTRTGFGEATGPRLRLVTGGGEPDAAEEAAADPDAARARREAALAERDAAQAALADAESAQQQAADEKRRAGATLSDLDDELARLQARRAGASQEAAVAESADLAARREVAAARRRLSQAEAELTAIDAEEAGPG